MEKPDNYGWYRNSRNKIAYNIWPQEVKDYFNWERRNRAKPEWSSLSDDERKIEQNKIIEANRNQWEFKKTTLSQNELDSINRSKGRPQSAEKRSEISKRFKRFWANMTTEERRAFSRKRWESQPEEIRKGISKRFNQAGIARMKSLPQEEIDAHIKNMNEARLLKYFSNPEFKQQQLDLLLKHSNDYNLNLTNEEREIHSAKVKFGRKQWWDDLSDNERKSYSTLISLRNKHWWASRTDEQLQQISQQMKNWNNKYWTPERRKTILTVASGKNKFHKKFEKCFQEIFPSNEFQLKPEESIDHKNKHWDYGVYNKNNQLVAVIDLDGEFFHADAQDYNGIHSHEEYDERRFSTIPTGIKFITILENNFEKSIFNMIKMLDINYNNFIDQQFQLCRSMPIPLPQYTDTELIKSFNQLTRLNCDSKYLKLSIRNREGDRIINHFHPSIYQAKCKGSRLSPYDAWHDDRLLRKVIQNRIIYINILNPNKILQGFNIAKVAQKVSVFSAGRAKVLIHKYLNDYDTIFDPFSGFSGRMLGAVSLNKKYIGQDISETHVKESNAIIDYFKLYNQATVTVNNVITSTGSYQCLFTCPPYQDKEQWYGIPVDNRSCDDWIDICLANFKCNKYLFVVDGTVKYKDKVVDTIVNRSHFGENCEYVILI